VGPSDVGVRPGGVEVQPSSESGPSESVLPTESAVEVRPRSATKESDQLAIDLVDCTKNTGRKVREFQLPEPKVSTDAGHGETGSREERVSHEGWLDRLKGETDGLRKDQILLVRGGSENDVAHHGQRPRAASSRERARTSRPATSFPSALRLSISPHHPGGT
jgi:hypothetical protein